MKRLTVLFALIACASLVLAQPARLSAQREGGLGEMVQTEPRFAGRALVVGRTRRRIAS